jgi:hypothetical protein
MLVIAWRKLERGSINVLPPRIPQCGPHIEVLAQLIKLDTAVHLNHLTDNHQHIVDSLL